MNSEIDQQGPWNIRAISTRLREAVALAAQREKITVGQWMERELRWLVDGGANPRVQPVKREANQLVPRGFTGMSNAVDDTPALVRAALDLAGATDAQKSDTLVKTARATVRRRLLAART